MSTLALAVLVLVVGLVGLVALALCRAAGLGDQTVITDETGTVDLFTLTDEQETARKYLDDYYAGDITITPCPGHGPDAVRLSVLWEGELKAFWVVTTTGWVAATFDPDEAVQGYLRRVAR